MFNVAPTWFFAITNVIVRELDLVSVHDNFEITSTFIATQFLNYSLEVLLLL